MARTYEDLRVELARLGDDLEVRVASVAGETSAPVRVALPASLLEDLRTDAELMGQGRLRSDDLLRFGVKLGRLLLPLEVRTILLRALDAAGDDGGVRLRLVVHDEALAALPWEYAYVRREGEFTRLVPYLLLEPRVSIVRHDPQDGPIPSVRALRDGQLRIVVAGARSLPGLADLAEDDDLGAIQAALGASISDLSVQVVTLDEPVSAEALRAALHQPADIFQFLGHGVGPTATQDGGLLVSDGAGGVTTLGPAELADLLRGADVRLAVLSACNSGERGSQGWVGVAQGLVRAGIPAVVAMQHQIESSHAVAFEAGLYTGLAAGLSIDESVAVGRRGVQQLGVFAEWGVPVLCTRSDGQLFTRPASSVLADQLHREMTRVPVDLTAGQELEGEGDWGKAAETYLSLLPRARGPREESVLRMRIGACLWRDGESDEAEEHLADARRLAQEVGDDHLLGEVLLEQGARAEEDDRLDEAARRYNEAGRAFGPDAVNDLRRVAIRLATVERRQGSLRSAYARLTAADLDPAGLPEGVRAEYYDALGAVLLVRGQFRHAVEVLELALDLDLLIHTEHAACATRLLLAQAHLGRGDRDGGMRQVDLALKIYEDADDESGLSEAWTCKGQILEDGGDYQRALHAYARASQYDAAGRDVGGEARAYRLLGRTALKRGDADAAEDYFSQAHSLLFKSQDDLEKAALLTEEAQLDLEEGEYEDAISKLENVLEIARNDEDERALAIAKRHLAAALRETGDLTRSAEMLHEARATLEERGDLRELEALLDDLGEVLIDLSEYDAAVEVLEQSLELDRELQTGRGRGRSMLLLGRANARLGKRAQAGRQFDEALEIYKGLKDTVGESDARLALGEWNAQEGKSQKARDLIQKALRTDRVQEDKLGVVRCLRALAGVCRRTSNWPQAEELLEEAEAELGNVPDRVERALLQLEHAELWLARDEYDKAIERASLAQATLTETGSVVEAAICERVIAVATAQKGDYDKAIVALEGVRDLFERRNVMIELNTTYDDLAEVFLLAGDLRSAREAVNLSLRLDEESSWFAGQGRSYLILGDVEEESGDHRRALDRFEEALKCFEEAMDEVGQAEVHLRLGSWHLKHQGRDGGEVAQAISHLKDGRRLFQLHHDLRGMSRAFRRLGEVYFERHELERAGEAYEQAEDCLTSLESDREMAPLHLAQARLLAAQGRHSEAIDRLEGALDLYRDMHREDRVNEVLRRMATAHQNLGKIDEALDCIRQIGLEQARIWKVLVDNVHEDIASAASTPYKDGSYGLAVRNAMDKLHSWIRRHERDEDPVIGGLRSLAEQLVEVVGSDAAQALWDRSSLEAATAIASAHLVLSLGDLLGSAAVADPTAP